jgi:hypothetical protein
MSDEGQRVTLADRITPVFLRKCGPEAPEAEIAAFEESLGYPLPNDYREFLRRFNGGYPIVMVVSGRDDDPTMPYSYGDGVRVFFKLQITARPVGAYERLRSPRDIEEAYGWGLPADALRIGQDAGGNMFVMELGHPKHLIRFVDHERLDEPFETHRVIAEGFTDLLMRFRTVEEQAEEDRLEYLAERERIISGAFSDALETQCDAVEQTYRHIRQWIREACLAVFEDKGYFSLHDDARSRMVLDLAFWLRQTASAMMQGDDAISLAATHENLDAWWRSQKGGFGLSGFAPGRLDDWWKDRVNLGVLQIMSDGRARMSTAATEALVTRFRGANPEQARS